MVRLEVLWCLLNKAICTKYLEITVCRMMNNQQKLITLHNNDAEVEIKEMEGKRAAGTTATSDARKQRLESQVNLCGQCDRNVFISSSQSETSSIS